MHTRASTGPHSSLHLMQRHGTTRGIVLVAMQRYNDSLVCFDAAIQADPMNYEAWGNKGNTLVSMGKLDDALSAFDRAIIINQTYAGAWIARG